MMKLGSIKNWPFGVWVIAALMVFAGFALLSQPSGQARAANGPPFASFLPAIAHGVYVPPTPLPPGATPQPTPPPNQPQPARVFGVEPNYHHKLDDLPKSNVHYARLNGVLWSQVEPERGVRDWSATDHLESEFVFAAQNGIDVILIVRSTPKWAQKVPGKICGPVKEEEFAAFALFMQDLVRRYSQPPFSVKYWELGNEPDIDPSLVGSDSLFGCWGDRLDAFGYGGGYYAKMLKVVTPAIKAVDPEAKVLIGGLLLSCNPNIEGACDNYDATLPPKFLRGILEEGGAPYFDFVSFHSYDRYDGNVGKYSMPPWRAAWNTTGPLILEKVKYLRGILAEYGVEDKPMINSETGLMVYESQCDSTCQMAKAYYVPQLYSATIASGVETSIWYSTYANWKHTDLFTYYGDPLPAYVAYSTAWDLLAPSIYVRELSEYQGVRGYVFDRFGGSLWLVWSADGGDHTLALPGVPLTITDVLGAAEPINGASYKVTLKPVYIQFP